MESGIYSYLAASLACIACLRGGITHHCQWVIAMVIEMYNYVYKRNRFSLSQRSQSDLENISTTEDKIVMNAILPIVIFAALLKAQVENWRKKLRPSFKFLLLAFCSSQTLAITTLMSSLPIGTFDYITKNLFDAKVFICAIILITFWFVGIFYTVSSAKLMKSLVG